MAGNRAAGSDETEGLVESLARFPRKSQRSGTPKTAGRRVKRSSKPEGRKGVEMADRDVSQITTSPESISTTFVTPEEQRQEDARQAEQQNLKRSKPLKNFFRIFGIGTADRP